MPDEFSAGRVAIEFSTDGYPNRIVIKAKHANGSQDQEPILLTHHDLLDLDHCLRRTIAAVIKG